MMLLMLCLGYDLSLSLGLTRLLAVVIVATDAVTKMLAFDEDTA